MFVIKRLIMQKNTVCIIYPYRNVHSIITIWVNKVQTAGSRARCCDVSSALLHLSELTGFVSDSNVSGRVTT